MPGFTLRIINPRAELAGPAAVWKAQYAVMHVFLPTGHVSGSIVESPWLRIDETWVETREIPNDLVVGSYTLFAMMSGIIFYDANGNYTAGNPLPIDALHPEDKSPIWGNRLYDEGRYIWDESTYTWYEDKPNGEEPEPGLAGIGIGVALIGVVGLGILLASQRRRK